ncbi:MAG: hypothetical protein ACREM8_04680 [Vulcanimicrobiaceae bacterium]
MLLDEALTLFLNGEPDTARLSMDNPAVVIGALRKRLGVKLAAAYRDPGSMRSGRRPSPTIG